LGQLSGYELKRARTFVEEAHLQYFDAGWMRPAGLYDYRPIDIIIEAIRDERVLVLQRGAAAMPAKSATAELRGLVAQLPQRGTLVFQGRQYKLVVADDLARLANHDRYEVVSQSAARAVLDGLAKESPASAQVLGQASEKIGKDWRPPFSDPEGLVLLRRIPVRAEGPRDSGPAITPSQVKALVEQGALKIHVVDLSGVPQKGIAFAITMPDGGSVNGTLDDDGRAEAKSSAPGVFIVKFPELDGADWDGDGALALPPKDTRSQAGSHKVEQGERLPTIARKQGFLRWQTVWDFAGNDELRRLRGDAHILFPGDQVSIPSKLERTAEVQGCTAEYVVQAAPEVLRVRFAEVEAIADAVTFRATPDTGDHMFEGELAGDGTMAIDLPPDATQVTVELYCGDGDNPFVTYAFEVGHVDPCSEDTGVQGRLGNLGYYEGEISGEVDDATRGAIVRFRREYGLPLSNQVDDDLRNALEWIHDDDDDTSDCEADQTTPGDFDAGKDEGGGDGEGGDDDDDGSDQADEDDVGDDDQAAADDASDDTGDGDDDQVDDDAGEGDERDEGDWDDSDDLELVEWDEEDWGDAAEDNWPDGSASEVSDDEEEPA
jgi:hypothetical protein